jgi:hypothetical protein
MGAIQAANYGDHGRNLGAGFAHRLVDPRTSIPPPRGKYGAGNFLRAYAHEPNGDGQRALSRHCPRDPTTNHRHGNNGQCGLAVAFKRQPRHWPGPRRNEQSRGGRSSSDVITNVRGLFGKDTEKKTLTDLNALIQSVLELVSIDLRKHNIESRVTLSEQLPPVVGNEVQLQQVILNLVTNAIESMNSAETRVLSIRSEIAGQNGVRVSIADTGSGIDLANLNRLFEPMFTTKARGMGMGLSICKPIIESHQGRIWVTAVTPKGSIFQFELPPAVPAISSTWGTADVRFGSKARH